jgi:hypothetical protein
MAANKDLTTFHPKLSTLLGIAAALAIAEAMAGGNGRE